MATMMRSLLGTLPTLAKAGPPLVATVLLAAACSSSSSGSSAPSTAAASAPAGSSSVSSAAAAGSGAAGGAVVTSTTGSAGTFLTDASGKALYLWVADTTTKSTCSGGCASAWPPLTTTGAPTAAGAAKASDLGTTKRSDGSLQVTYDGHPLYYFVGDSGKGETKGQGSNSFGAKWWLVTPAGTAITTGS